MRWLIAPILLVALATDASAQAEPEAQPEAQPDAQPDELPAPPDPVPESPPDEPLPAPVPDPEPSGPPPQPVGPAPEDFGQMGTTRRAHTGLLLRGYTGFGLYSTSATTEGVETAVGGTATSLGLSAGYSLRPRLAVHFDVVLNVMPNGQINVDGADSGMDASGGLIGAGPGVSYYLPPKVNAYLAGSVVLFDRFLNQDDMQLRNTKGGFGLNGVFGKEWWLGGNVGLGVVGQVFFGNTKDAATDDTWTTFAFTLNFSATYN